MLTGAHAVEAQTCDTYERSLGSPGIGDSNRTRRASEEPNRAAPSDPPRIIKRSVTTVRETATGSFSADRQVFKRDLNGRLVLVCTETESSSGNLSSSARVAPGAGSSL